jgi:hypothetical protein
MLTGKKITPDEFEARYLGEKKVWPGLIPWLRGVPIAHEPDIAHRDELKALLEGHIDYYSPEKPLVPVTHEDVPVEMGKGQTRLYEAMWGRLPWMLRWKLKHEYPLTDDELKRATAFLTGPRQIGLSPMTFMGQGADPYKAFQQSTKLQEAMKRLKDKLGDPRTKALIFSNFIAAGLEPYAAALRREGIPYGIFHGGLNDAARKKLVEDYNAGSTPFYLGLVRAGPQEAAPHHGEDRPRHRIATPCRCRPRPARGDRGRRHD